ncbi:protein DBF4 homolog A isoform X2 [Archocentrus centrarchus]|nr:protein DBF4 homolog A isoform X2 [Archocentrus centrarchus]
MKPKRTQKHPGSNREGKGGHTGEKVTLSQAKRTSLPAQVKPFAGKVFYLDLPSNRVAETLESDIKQLGGTVEKFFSKDIKYLVSNKREARYVKCLRQDSPVPSPDSGPSSPCPRSNPQCPGSHGDIKSRSQGQTDTFVTSRGKSLVERVVKEQERAQMNKILSNALEWGIKILYVDDLIAYVHKKKKLISNTVPAATAINVGDKAASATKQSLGKCKGGRISKPFIKVEDSSRHYRPVYLTMPNMPEFNLKTSAPCSPFCPEDKDPPVNKQLGHRGVKASGSEERAHGRKKNRDKKRGGYCECCTVKYNQLTVHLQSGCHQAFSKSDEYLAVDRLVSTLTHNFMHIKTSKLKRPKCSVSSVLIAPGPCGEPELRHKGNPSETVQEEEPWTVDVNKELNSRQDLKIRSAPVSAELIHKEGDQRNCYTYSGRSRHKSLARKRPCRQNSLTSCTQKANQARNPQFESEEAPSRSEFLPSLPTRDSQDDPVKQILHDNMNTQTELSSKSLSVKTNEQESDKKMTESFSPVQKIQRKIKVYKHKRRKVDPNVEHVEPCDVPDNSLLKLWKLFQSSDDMDVEFHGFED